MNEWNVLCGGPSLLETAQEDVKAPPHHSVFVNSAIRHEELDADYWAVRDTNGFTVNIEHHKKETLIIPEAWKHKIDNEMDPLFSQRKQFSRSEKIFIPSRDNFYEMVFDNKADYSEFVYTFIQAITFTIIRGADHIHLYGFDTEGQGIDNRTMNEKESERIVSAYQELKWSCERQKRTLTFHEHGRYSDDI